MGLEKYLKAENPHIWRFNKKKADGRYSVSGLSWGIIPTGCTSIPTHLLAVLLTQRPFY
ncbi:MAG: hypothetical protein ACOCXH_05300 [Cyclobacteriaceae bacterium]